MRNGIALILLAILTALLSACGTILPVNSPALQNGSGQSDSISNEHTPTPLMEETPTPTPTIVWFPPTLTPTPFPTQAINPTPEMRPGLGDIILTDDFSESGTWMLRSSGEARVALSKNELTLAIAPSTSKDYIFSLREEPVLTNFYAEITASPSMCRGSDEYGLLVRATSTQDYYRFALTCSSQTRFERIINNQTTSPQAWVLSGAIPPGAPGTARLGIWVVGKEMRFFVNDEYLYTINDPLLASGMLGVYARSVGDNAVTINFSDLVIKEIDP